VNEIVQHVVCLPSDLQGVVKRVKYARFYESFQFVSRCPFTILLRLASFPFAFGDLIEPSAGFACEGLKSATSGWDRGWSTSTFVVDGVYLCFVI